jgi:hypothetical protein
MSRRDHRKIVEIWDAAEADQDSSLDLPVAARSLNLSESQALEFLAADVLKDASSFTSPWTCHFMDLALIVVGAGVMLLFSYLHSPRADQDKRVTLVAPNGVKTLQVITSPDIALKPVKETKGSFEKLEGVVGRYALRPISKDEVLTSKDLSSSPLPAGLAGREQISLPVNSGDLANTIELPGLVSLIATPKCKRSKNKPLSLNDVYVIAFDAPANPTVAVVALTAEQLATLTPFLGCGEFTLVKTFGGS